METLLSEQGIFAEGLIAASQDGASTEVTRSEEASETNSLTAMDASPGSQPQQLASPPTIPASAGRKIAARRSARTKKPGPADAAVPDNTLATAPLTPKSISGKRKRATPEEVRPDSKDLPHGLGRLGARPKATVAKKGSGKGSRSKKVKVGSTNLAGFNDSIGEGESEEDLQPKKAKAEKSKAQEYLNSDDPTVLARLMPDSSKFAPSKYARAYRHRWGETPFPDFEAVPTEAYQMVNDLLSSHHGKKQAPAATPPPSQTFAGCGETRCIIDALIRTRISANTDGNQTSVVIQSMLDTFGSKKTGTGKDSINWDVVHHSPVKKIAKTMHLAGNQNIKAQNVKDILDMVCKENNVRRRALADLEFAKDVGLDNDSAVQESAKVALADPNIVSLDHMHALSYHQAFSAFIEYPGIALKTASCVCLYCLQRPSFAVDTHVKRITGWLGWRPEEANENKTFTHLEYLIPDELKYSLHTLFVVHGKECIRCASDTHEETPGWEKGCVIDHLVKRVKKINAVRAAKALKASLQGRQRGSSTPTRLLGNPRIMKRVQESIMKDTKARLCRRIFRPNQSDLSAWSKAIPPPKRCPPQRRPPVRKNKAVGASMTKTAKAKAKAKAAMKESMGKVEKAEGEDVAMGLEEEEDQDGFGGEEEE